MTSPTIRFLLACAACALALVMPTSAMADEAGDDIAHATGPLAGATTYAGTFDTDTDQEWWYFYTAPSKPIDIAVTKLPGGCGSVAVSFRDSDGGEISLRYVNTNTTTHFNFTTAATPKRYYLLINRDSCNGSSYQISIQGADAVTDTPPGSQPTVPTASETEPNDNISQAFGPLWGATTYGGTFGTDTDSDWWMFYTNPQRPIDVAVTSLGGGGCGSLTVSFRDGDGGEISLRYVNTNTTTHFNFTTPLGSRRYYLAVSRSGCHGLTYIVRIDPADALTQTVPPIDADKDGIPDVSDLCPQKSGAAPSGCPDTDGDGITDNVDQCGNDRGPAPTGCPDSDGDGIPNKDDRCSTTAGKASAGGCPDRDGDGFADADDACKTLAGVAPKGCPLKQRYATLVTLRRSGHRFAGRVSSSGPGCANARKVVLRRGSRTLARTVTRANGTFTIVAGYRVRGRVRVVVAERSLKTRLCRTAASRLIRG
jgi:hypothetical protein